MPVIYGNVGGRKHAAQQPLHDPLNPKPSRYAPKGRGGKGEGTRWKGAVMVDGCRVYGSVSDAAESVGVCPTCLQGRLAGKSEAAMGGHVFSRIAMRKMEE